MATESEPGNLPPKPPGPPRSERSTTRAALAELVATSPGVVKMDAVPDGRRHPFWLMIAVLLALAGTIVSFELTMRGYQQQTALSSLAAPFCGDDGDACDRVAQSEWGRLELDRFGSRGAVPTALIGLMYFGFLLLWYLFVGRANYPGRARHLIPLVLTLAGTGVSAWLTYVMYRVLEVTCPLCMAVHVINALLLIVTMILWPGRGEVESSPVPVAPMPSGRLVLTGLALAALTGYAGTSLLNTWLARARGSVSAVIADQLNNFYRDGDLMAYVWRRAEPAEIPVDASDAIRGPADADHTVVMFSDFYCSACLNAAKILNTQVQRLPDVSVRVVYKYRPMDQACNVHAKTTKFPGSCEASMIGEAVLQQKGNDAFWKFHDAVFAAQRELGPSRVREIASQVGLSDVEAAVKDPAIEQRVQACIEQADALSVTRHPTVFLDGRRVEAWHELSTWEAILGVKAATPTTQPAGAT